MDRSGSGHRDLRREILDAAQQLFIERGYHALAMRQIAEAVGVSKPALYYHFQDKEELFLAVVLQELEVIDSLLARIQAQGGPVRGQVVTLVHVILNLPPKERATIRLASQEMSHLGPAAQRAVQSAYREQFLEKVRAILVQGIQTGELRPVDPDVAAWALLGMMYPYFYPSHAQDVPPPETVASEILAIFLDGLAA